MPTDYYVDIFAAKDRVIRMLRDMGTQPYSRLLMNAQLPEDVLNRVLKLLEDERKLRILTPQNQQAEVTYQPVSGAWSLSGAGA